MPQKTTHHCPRQNHRGRCVNVKARRNISPFYCRTHKVLCTRHRPAIAHLSTEECPSCAKALSLLKTKTKKCVVKKAKSAKKRRTSVKKCAPVKKSSLLKKSKWMKK